MREMTARLADDGLRRRCEAARRDYLARREMRRPCPRAYRPPPGAQSRRRACPRPGKVPARPRRARAGRRGVNPFGARR